MKKTGKNTFTTLGLASAAGPELEERLALCPTLPGVYIMKDTSGHVIYVGKAKNLRVRVRSYFRAKAELDPKTQHLVSKIHDIEFLSSGTEIEALLLENNLIKKWRPKYNIRLRDDKTYPYLKLDTAHPFPRPYIARKQVKGDGAEYYGPFPVSGGLKPVLKLAATVFQLRDCRDHEFANRSRPCLSYEVGQCTAPCVEYVSAEQYQKQVADFRMFVTGENRALEDKWEAQMQQFSENLEFEKAATLRDHLAAIRSIVSQERSVVDSLEKGDRDVWALAPESGESDLLALAILQVRGGRLLGNVTRLADLRETLPTEDLLASLLMQHYSKQALPDQILVPPEAHLPALQEFAEALVSLRPEEEREKVPEIRKAGSRSKWFSIFKLAQENAGLFLEEQRKLLNNRSAGLLALQRMLDLPSIPFHMECVDISNFQGAANVASCVVFKGGRPEKALYRHYNIQGFEGQNDFASMQEVMSRRYAKPDSPVPDLLVVDGGKGQLASAKSILDSIGAKFPIVALAKSRVESNFESSNVRASEERVFVPNQKNFIKFKDLEALKIMTHIRDEAHRFAIEFHRKKRSGQLFSE